MTEKTARQIENMKAQTFGVEVEGNNITRQKAAKVAADFFGTGRYEYTASRNGYMTWSAWDAQGREWKFQRDVSISGPDDEKCELVTPILTYADMETFQELLRTLRHAGMKSSPSRGCGVHIHIGLKGLDGKVVSPDFLARVNRQKPQTMQRLADCWYEGNHASYGRNQHYNDSRYHMLNLHASFTKGTIEFRLFQFSDPHGGKRGGIHAGEMKAYIQLCLAMSELAKELTYASPKPQQTDNEKYAMRCWMLRLGFIGDEFETAREILLKNMDGNAAWRQAAC